MNELALFAGAGGGILGGKLLGWRTVCAVELASYPRQVLLARQRDGILPRFPIWDDIATFDGRPWKGHVDVVSGGFPCQDISAAGKGAGINGQRSGLWAEMARIVGEVQPKFVLVENSPMLTSRGLDRVLGDLASLGYNAKWGVLGAFHTGAPHKRDRIWIVAYSNRQSSQIGRNDYAVTGIGGCRNTDKRRSGKNSSRIINPETNETMAHTNSQRLQEQHAPPFTDQSRQYPRRTPQTRRITWWKSEPNVGRVVDGLANRVDRLAALGNGQVPAVVRLAWETLTETNP